MVFRYFELTDSASNTLFWEVKNGTGSDKVISIREGEVGSNGQESSIELDDEATMLGQAEKLIAERIAMGYKEKGLVDRALVSLPTAFEAIALYEEARRLIRILQTLIEEKYPRDPKSYEMGSLPDLLADAQRGGLAWNLLIEEVPLKDVDRRKPMLKGPFFLTEDFPIPRTSDGKFMAPLIQADLRDLSKIRGLPFGDGLLQAWYCDYIECRVIPRQVVEKQDPIPFPTDIDQFSEYALSYIKDWITVKRFGETLQESERVVPMLLGYQDPFICVQPRFLVDITWDEFVAERGREMEDSPEPADFTRLIELLRKLEDDHHYGDHAFGSFHALQVSAKDMDSDPLFVFESDNFSFGDTGNAHIMYSFKEGKPDFWGRWDSC